MKDEASRRRPLVKWSLIAAGWTLFGLFFAVQSIAVRAYDGRPLRVGEALSAWLLCAYLWLALTPLVLRLARRFPIERRSWRRNLPAHVAAAVLLSLLQLAAYVTIASWLGKIPANRSFFESFRGFFVGDFHFDLLTYGAIVGLVHALDYYRKYRERELRASQLETKLAQAQLDALRMQLHPHFLFNTLNSISVLMAEDVRAARRMLARLSDLLRTSLEEAGAHEVALHQELEFLESYLEIEQTRFQDRLTVRMEIDPAALDARVPNLILQPLVENAIRHGIAPRARAGTVEIRAARENGAVRLAVADDGAGLGSARPEDLMKGIGLSNTRSRLEQLYGAAHRFEMREREGGGLEVSIEIPFRSGGEGTRA
ncbi:MAG TPA: histidine kinase [Pyrinomonadaceae bacterium]|nr:histidine kinase [Pyrinomonadaceae bacterium]